MKQFTFILLIILFLLQGTNEYNVVVLFLFIVLLSTTFVKKGVKLVFPSYFLLAVIIYFFYLLIGIFSFHENLFIDVKFQIFSFIFFFWLINHNFKVDFERFLFVMNIIVFVIYIMLFFNLLPNLWSGFTLGFGGRVYGPSIISINLLLFYYLLSGKPIDKKLIVASILGLIYIALTTNFMNLAVFAALAFLLMVNFNKLLKPMYLVTIIAVLIGVLMYLNSPYVPELVAAKMQYIYKPWEYGSLKTRVEDFKQVVNNENFGVLKSLFGEGYGTSSQIYRYNPIAVSLSRTFSFQEIDNGFYYLYHRGGWSLLMVFVLSHLYLLKRIPYTKAKIAFLSMVIITNLLSIHYFNYYFYLLLPFFVLYRVNISEKLVRL